MSCKARLGACLVGGENCSVQYSDFDRITGKFTFMILVTMNSMKVFLLDFLQSEFHKRLSAVWENKSEKLFYYSFSILC